MLVKQWASTYEYRFTAPLNNKKVSHYLKIAILLAKGELKSSRPEILRQIGIKKSRAYSKGQNSCVFTALNQNKVIKYGRSTKKYDKGPRFKEFMEYTLKEINSLKSPSNKVKKFIKENKDTILKEVSNARHFIETC